MELPGCHNQLEACIHGSEDFHGDYLDAFGALNIHRSVQKAMTDEGTVKPTIVKADTGNLFGTKGRQRIHMMIV